MTLFDEGAIGHLQARPGCYSFAFSLGLDLCPRPTTSSHVIGLSILSTYLGGVYLVFVSSFSIVVYVHSDAFTIITHAMCVAMTEGQIKALPRPSRVLLFYCILSTPPCQGNFNSLTEKRRDQLSQASPFALATLVCFFCLFCDKCLFYVKNE